MQPNSNEALWQQYMSGDQQARERILAAYLPRIAGLVRRDLRVRDQHEDLAQSVMMSFLTNHEKQLGPGSQADDLWPLFASITLRHCCKHRKRAERHPAASLEGAERADETSTPDEIAGLNDLMETCRKRLSPRQQEVLRRHLQGMRRGDIARDLEVAIPTVDRDLEKIRTVLGELAAPVDE